MTDLREAGLISDTTPPQGSSPMTDAEILALWNKVRDEIGPTSIEEWDQYRHTFAVRFARAMLASPPPVTPPGWSQFLREFVNLCAVGDITEDSDDGLGWADLVKRANAMLAAATKDGGA